MGRRTVRIRRTTSTCRYCMPVNTTTMQRTTKQKTANCGRTISGIICTRGGKKHQAPFLLLPVGNKQHKANFPIRRGRQKNHWRPLIFAVGLCSFVGTFFCSPWPKCFLKGAFRHSPEFFIGNHVLVFAIG